MKTLPDTFKFKHFSGDDTVYSADRCVDEWYISWEDEMGGELGNLYSKDSVEICIRDGLWIIQKEFTDVLKMTLPDKFKFTCQTLPTVYKAKLIGRNYHVSWYDNEECSGSVQYTVDMAREYFVRGEWTIYLNNPSKIVKKSEALNILIHEKNDASELEYDEVKALRLLRGLINRLLDDGK